MVLPSSSGARVRAIKSHYGISIMPTLYIYIKLQVQGHNEGFVYSYCEQSTERKWVFAYETPIIIIISSSKLQLQ